MAHVPGTRLGHFEIVSAIGAGGMGEVYRAIDTRLNRTVAIKVLPAAVMADAERRRRFVQEAQAASALNHPNIVSIYEIDSDAGTDFIAMEYVDGESLDRLIARGVPPIDRAVRYAIEIVDALATAHEAGIIHRDIKPGNIMISRSDHAKVLDFGLAKLLHGDVAEPVAATRTAVPPTVSGTILGTAAYMSPEQAEGLPVDARTDIFALGTVLYELLTGRRAFQGRSHLSTLAAVLREQPTPMRELREAITPDLDRIVTRCLAKQPADRYASATALGADLRASVTPASTAPATTRRRLMWIGIAVALSLAVLTSVWALVRSSRTRTAHNVTIPQIEALVNQGKPDDAYRLLRQVQRVIPDDPEIRRLVNNVTDPAAITSDPPGADAYTRGYLESANDWLYVGKTPLSGAPVPFGYRAWRLSKDGFETREVATGPQSPQLIRLSRTGDAPPGMVLVAGDSPSSVPVPAPMEDFWLDRYEVTNRQFKTFVDAGGYTNRSYWKYPFVKDGAEIAWDEAMRLFRDTTGRSGPAVWELGSYPEGQAEWPVTGVSWFEAAAYAEYAGKSLPTYYHWYQAAAQSIYSEILVLSNFKGKGLARVGEYRGLGAFGTYDMAGNAKEWCSTATADRRYILGGAWNEPTYLFSERDAQSPFVREANFGFRCAKYPKPPAEALSAAVEPKSRDYSRERPASDETYRLLRSFYAYDRSPLNATVDSLPDDSPHWRRELVTFDAAYGRERVPGFLFLPRQVAPPYQAVIFAPSGSAFQLRSNAHVETRQFQFVIQSGRAVFLPIYRGTYDRWVQVRGERDARDVTIQDAKDFLRALDYLETRPDIDKTRLGFYGISAGADGGSLALADEQRIKAAVLLSSALPDVPVPPEVDPINFVPRVRLPVLMLNGKYDFGAPVETLQEPLFRLLGAPPAQKKHVVFETGHAVTTIQPMIKEILDWFDRYLGPVRN